jgi:1-deoxy-D-xylulose-5-phosphate reductoisomerase
MMNKGLEAIEAHHLFHIPMERIHILIHPQSIVHSLVEFVDGSMLAQLSMPDMKLPIQFALTYPGRLPGCVRYLDLAAIKKLEFDTPDFRKFPCLALALKAGAAGGTMPVVMNAANEIAVESFLREEITLSDIAGTVAAIMRKHHARRSPGLEDIFTADAWAREESKKHIGQYRKGQSS